MVKCLQNVQISLPLGQQDNCKALPPSQSNRSNPRPMARLLRPPPPPPAGLTLIGALTLKSVAISSICSMIAKLR